MNYKLHFSAVAVAAVLFLGSCQKESVNTDLNAAGGAGNPISLKAGNANGPGVSANGQGALIFNERFQHFSFHAKKDADGTVAGNVIIHSPGQETNLQAEVVCLMVNGTEATVTALITKATEDNPYGIEVGRFIVFKVKDNGEGSGAPADQFTDAYPTTVQRDCNLPLNIALVDIVAGNIQVKDE